MGPESGNQLLGLIKESPQIIPLIYTDLAQPSVKKVGAALETVFEFSTSLLLPLKLLNERFKLNFERNLNSYKKKLDGVPEDKIISVDPQIGTPIIEKLSYTTNEEIADLFTTLLAKASNIDTVNQTHPSFIHIIERLSVDEARILKHLKGISTIPCMTLRAYVKDKDKGFIIYAEKANMLIFDVNIDIPQNINTYLDNLCSAGILFYADGTWLTEETGYELISKHHEFETWKSQILEESRFGNVDEDKCFFRVTSFGKQFIEACTLND
jgi:hypothetical protein